MKYINRVESLGKYGTLNVKRVCVAINVPIFTEGLHLASPLGATRPRVPPSKEVDTRTLPVAMMDEKPIFLKVKTTPPWLWPRPPGWGRVVSAAAAAAAPQDFERHQFSLALPCAMCRR